MPTVYFDSNVLFDVLGRRPGLFDDVKSAVEAGHVEIICSDTHLIEFFSGANRDDFRTQVEHLLGLHPSWVSVATLTQRELQYEYAQVIGRTAAPPLQLFARWKDFLPLVTAEAERHEVPPDALIPTAEALSGLYSATAVRERLAHWKLELQRLKGRVAEEMVYVGTRRNYFWKTVAHSLDRNFGDTAELVNRLWANPDRAPALRIDFELTLQDLDHARPRWTTNNFLDYVHARLLPYVDLFMTRDDPFIDKVSWFDKNVRVPNGALPYRAKMYREWREATARLK